MLYTLPPSPTPDPSVTPMPDVGQVSDFSAAISGLIGAVLLVIAGLAWRKANAWFAEVIADVKATKVQTTNSHDTNLRDDLTSAIEAINNVASDVGEMKEQVKKLDTRHTEMHQDLRETRKDLRFATEYVRDVDKRFIEHIDDERKNGGSTNG